MALTVYTAGEVLTSASLNANLSFAAANPPAPAVQVIRGNYIATSQATTSTTYVDLATVGPAVTLTTGTSVLVKIQTLAADSVTNRQLMSFAVSGATTLAAGSNFEMAVDTTNNTGVRSAEFVVTGLTAGSNTFTAKYRSSDGNSIPYAKRLIKVITL